MEIRENVSLRPFNTFGVEAKAAKLATFTTTEELQELLKDPAIDKDKLMILGGGSNILFTRDFDGTILLNRIKGIDLIDEDEETYVVRSGAGEVWHDFVTHTIDHGWAGLENLSLIPGNVGASPIQNIGAYGIEIKERFEELEAVKISDGSVHTFKAADCQFGYRDSVFKRELKGQYVITSVTFRLLKEPQLNTSYGAIEQELERMGITDPDIKAVSQAVINIRQSKLPDPKVTGNAGSFFKNPVISVDRYNEIKEKHPNIPGYPAGEGMMKVAAGWLIDQAGWKGTDRGDYGVHDRQALVLVNRGGATGSKVFDLSEDILTDIKEKYGIDLEREVNII